MGKGGGSNNGMVYGLPSIQSNNSSSSGSNNIPKWLEDASQYGVQNAKNMLSAGTPQYNNPLTAGITSNQQKAGNLINNSIGQGQNYFNNANTAINNSMGNIAPSTILGGMSGINQYMSPYISNVVDSVKAMSNQNLNSALTSAKDSAIKSGAYGGSRQGVMEGVATAQNNLNTNNLVSNLLNQGYGQALSSIGSDAQTKNSMAQQNAANSLAGGQALANLGMTSQTANNNNINNLLQ